MGKGNIGVYGLGVMGRNLALNLEEHGYRVSLYNRTVPGKEEDIVSSFLEEEGKNKDFVGTESPEAFIGSLKPPRKVLLMVKAGDAVDKVIDQLTPLLSPGDILIDGGNSHFKDTVRRVQKLQEMEIHFVGMGVSGGETGARRGPSLMPGGSKTAWKSLKPILQNIAATDPEGKPCCTWIGTEGAGHFVKMVHNGIEYADMQLIAECYHFMREVLEMPIREIGTVFESWNSGELNSYLLEITSKILKVTDDKGEPLVEKILDSAGQKGTGLWTSVSALESGTPLPTITSAVFSRVFSSFKGLRINLSQKLGEPSQQPLDSGEASRFVTALEKALIAGRVITLAEGFFFIKQLSEEKNWNIDLAEVARVWQNGCIIRSELLIPVRKALQAEINSSHLLKTELFSMKLLDLIPELRNVASTAIQYGVPVPAMSNVLAQYDMLRSEKLPANLIQAQRDFFGAHTYERVDRPRGEYFHTDWSNANDKT
ncbi:decarboxylating NADP(+)-dependent phosphogluconate dehydrogenase [Balneolaceae bacterium YR4-1]|uniref:6-phosphogluconate dehydrogenase, decarboxylating n=2 Tax=Halalkalibaculum roseum TaxID=2709311 RepID=A0A6M1SKF6_9BACT|nr:decarboxylating NADP(+)-dependent phosphogluconate dehydrogenase [Halalkalibaculum roseum]